MSLENLSVVCLESIRYWISTLFQLSRFHTRESWLAWYPAVWGLCFAISTNPKKVDFYQATGLLFFNWLCMTLIHASFCTWNDIIDRDVDRFATRTSCRPLPSGRCSVSVAFAWFIVQLMTVSLITVITLGIEVLVALLPSCTLAFLYPLTKRVVHWPQFVLALSLGLAVWPGWVSFASYNVLPLQKKSDLTISGDVRPDSEGTFCTPLSVAYAAWTVYFDTAYGLQDIDGDRLSGIGSLAQVLGRRWYKPFMILLNISVVASLQMAVFRSNLSFLVSKIGIGMWLGGVPLQIHLLDPDDAKSGGRVFGFNITLGLMFTFLLLGDVYFNAAHVV